MELLGFVAFFGILLINANSYRLELTMCIFTVFNISSFAFILCDLDHAFHGTFVVDLSVFTDFLDELQREYTNLIPPVPKDPNHALTTEEFETVHKSFAKQQPGPLFGKRTVLNGTKTENNGAPHGYSYLTDVNGAMPPNM